MVMFSFLCVVCVHGFLIRLRGWIWLECHVAVLSVSSVNCSVCVGGWMAGSKWASQL